MFNKKNWSFKKKFWVSISLFLMLLLLIISILVFTVPNSEFLSFIAISHWQTVIIVWFILISTIILGYYRGINDSKIISKSFKFVILGGIIYGLMTGLSPVSETNPWTNETSLWLMLITAVFMVSMIIIVPFFIFFTITRTMVVSRGSGISIENMAKSFLSIWLMPLIAITIAIIILPLILLIPPFPVINNGSMNAEDFESALTTLPGIIYSFLPSALSMFLGVGKVLSVVALAMFVGVMLMILHKKHHKESEIVIHSITHVHTFITKIIFYIAMLIPMVIATRLTLLFNFGDMVSNFETLFIFMCVFIFGWIIVIIFELSMTFLTMKNRDKKNFFRYIKEYFLTAFIKHAASILMEETIKESESLGVSEDIAKLTSSMSTSMGQSTCGGFYPAMIALMTASMSIQQAETGWPPIGAIISFILVMYIVIMITNLGMTGVPGADTAVILSVLSGVGMPFTYFMNVFAVDGIINHIRGIANAFGFVAANNIAEKVINTKHHKEKHAGEELFKDFDELVESYDFTKNEDHHGKKIPGLADENENKSRRKKERIVNKKRKDKIK